VHNSKVTVASQPEGVYLYKELKLKLKKKLKRVAYTKTLTIFNCWIATQQGA